MPLQSRDIKITAIPHFAPASDIELQAIHHISPIFQTWVIIKKIVDMGHGLEHSFDLEWGVVPIFC